MTTSEAVRRLPLLAHLDDPSRELVAEAGAIRGVSRGAILFHEGTPADAMYGLLAGQVKLVRYSARGRELLLHLVRGGQTFAEAALFGSGTYPATAEVIEDGEVWVLGRERLLALVERAPELGLALAGSVSVWTRRLVNTLELMTQRRVEERVAVYLMARAGDRHLAAGDRILLSDARQLIAAQIGTAPEVLSRTVRRLEDEGVLSSDPRGVTVLDPLRLRELAEWIED